jgi:hypothetical protein
MKAVLALVLGLVAAGCMHGNDDDSERPPDPASWPPPHGIGDSVCASGITDGDSCTDVGWCKNCDVMIGCYCDGDHYECHQAASLCDFGEGTSCAREGTPACNTPPAPAYCTCTDTEVVCEYVCPFAACPDYDPVSSACTCAGGSCL